MTTTQDCFHCGAPVGANEPPRTVHIQSHDRAMCCPGCEAVASTIVSSGFEAYYSSRDGYANTATGAAGLPPEMALYDAPEVLDQFAPLSKEENESDLRETMLSIEGIRCGACVWLIERQLMQLPGVRVASLNVATERLLVKWRDAACKPSAILAALAAIGYQAQPYDPVRHDAHLQRSSKTLFRQVFIAGLSMMQVMMYAFPVYIAGKGDMDVDMRALMDWASLLLTIPAVFYSALPFFRGAWANLRARTLGMDVPVALGIGAAFIGSVVATVSGSGDVYYDSVTMFIFLLLCSRYMELLARRKAASALAQLQLGLPDAATRLPAFPEQRETEVVPAARLRVGDHILVKPGEAFAADCVLVEGNTSIDVSLLTGESIAQARSIGASIPGGAINATQAAIARVSALAKESTLSVLLKLVERAGQSKPQLAQWADRVAAWFVAGLLLFAVAVFFAWQWLDPQRAWPIAIAVLVVSCPCALSMATPSALAAAVDRLVRQGVLAIQPHVIETLHRVTHVVFDKTGTLTAGKPAVRTTRVLGNLDEARCLALAAALEQSSSHPIAQALIDAAAQPSPHNVAVQVSDIVNYTGSGIEAQYNGQRVRLGAPNFVAELCDSAAPVGGTGTLVYLGIANQWLAVFELHDALRPDAAEVVQFFQSRGKKVILLSGDAEAVVKHVAATLRMDEAHGGVLPEDKLSFVQHLQEQGGIVAMVGDGINDAAVLRGADVSFSMPNAATLAQAHADAVLLSPNLFAVCDAARTAEDAMRVVKQNLFWASAYNITAIPAAAIGWINPWMAGVGMAASSALVVMNALRLRHLPRKPLPHAATPESQPLQA